jgi:serine/threonine protein kinase
LPRSFGIPRAGARRPQSLSETTQEPALLARRGHLEAWKCRSEPPLLQHGEPSVGEGGNALVFDTPFAGGTAIKFLAELVSAPPSKRYARFLDEYRNLIKLVSTGAIVPIYQFGIQNMDDTQIPYIIMEHCVKSLNDVFQSNRLVDVNVFNNLLERMLQILEIIHGAKIVHRDIKPQNILLRSNGTGVLGDFGIAWFDPEIYQKIAQTDRNERLANWGFLLQNRLEGAHTISPLRLWISMLLGKLCIIALQAMSLVVPTIPVLARFLHHLLNMIH